MSHGYRFAEDRCGYEVVIGLEVHAQLLTASKMFCRCATDYANAAPNTHDCPICMGIPGTLPVINRAGRRRYTIMTGLALHCEIPEYSKFDRKNYFYPDLPKGYQISQYDMPLSTQRLLEIHIDGEERRVGITRIHLEEDTGRHLERERRGEAYSLIDLNRAGVPLMEIVGEPDMRTPEEARLYMEKLRTILRLPRRELWPHGGGRAPLRRQHLGCARAADRSSAPRSRSRI